MPRVVTNIVNFSTGFLITTMIFASTTSPVTDVEETITRFAVAYFLGVLAIVGITKAMGE